MLAGLAQDIGVISLGDYIDLVSLSIAGYPDDVAGDKYGKLTSATNTDFSPNGKLLRLIVVGINTFREEPDKDHTGSYADNGSEAAPHLVFQFQNLPVKRWMLSTYSADSYVTSSMRKYLVDVEGSGGNFFAGLIDAGVPTDIVWAPKRFVANPDKKVALAELIEDNLWLPTMRELFGKFLVTHPQRDVETAANQARLAYYSTTEKMKKMITSTSTQWYYPATPVEVANGSTVFSTAGGNSLGASAGGVSAGCPPAFCVR
jgi:hypothetical protein